MVVTSRIAAVAAAKAVALFSCRTEGSSERVDVPISVMLVLSSDIIAGKLVSKEHEARDHQGDVGGERMAAKARGVAPVSHRNQYCPKGQELPDFDTDIEGYEIDQQAIGRQGKFLQFRRKTEAVEETEYQDRSLGVGLKAEPALIGAQIIQRL